MSENKDKLLEDIKKIVDGIFSEKEKSSQITKTQEALNESAKTIEDLTNNLEDTKVELEDVKVNLTESKDTASKELEDKDLKISEISSELEAAQKELDEKNEELSSIQEKLENLEKDRVAEIRMKDLEEAKVIVASDVETQTIKVRDLTDEEFATYKKERVELREAIEKELSDASNTEEIKIKKEEKKSDGSVENTESGAVIPANEVTPGQAVASAMNFETEVSSGVKEKYKNLGIAMAKNLFKAPSKK